MFGIRRITPKHSWWVINSVQFLSTQGKILNATENILKGYSLRIIASKMIKHKSMQVGPSFNDYNMSNFAQCF